MNLARTVMTVLLVHVVMTTDAQNVSFSAKDISLQDVFAIIKRQTGVLFFYDAQLLQNSKLVSVTLKNVTLETALNEVFKGQGFNWVLENNIVTIIKNPYSYTKPDIDKIKKDFGDQVSGIVTSEEGHPIHAVTVLVKGTKPGTVSNEAGEFTIKASTTNTLIFSSVNYATKELQVTSEKVKVVLQLELRPMEAMVVGGNLIAIKRGADANSITVLDSKTLEKIPGTTLDQVFRGWAPGVNNFDIGNSPEQFAKVIEFQIGKWAKLVKEANIKSD